MTFDDPVTLYKGHDTKVTHSQKEYDDAIKEGFGPYQKGEHEYPKVMHHETENKVLVFGKDQEQEVVAKGYREKPFRLYPLNERPPAPIVMPLHLHSAAGSDALLAMIADLQRQILALSSGKYVTAQADKPATVVEPAKAVEEPAKIEDPAPRRRREA